MILDPPEVIVHEATNNTDDIVFTLQQVEKIEAGFQCDILKRFSMQTFQKCIIFVVLATLLKANKRIYEGKGQISSSFMTDFIEFGRIDTRGASGLFVNHTFIAFYIDYVT